MDVDVTRAGGETAHEPSVQGRSRVTSETVGDIDVAGVVVMQPGERGVHSPPSMEKTWFGNSSHQ